LGSSATTSAATSGRGHVRPLGWRIRDRCLSDRAARRGCGLLGRVGAGRRKLAMARERGESRSTSVNNPASACS
jgi:hypothetical protein